MGRKNTDRSRILRRLGLRGGLVALLGAASVLGGCNASEPPKREAGRVKVIAARPTDLAPVVSLTGEIKARFQNDLSFRVSGKIVERNVDVGAHVQPGDLLARLEPNEEAANLKSAKAAVEAAEAQLKQV